MIDFSSFIIHAQGQIQPLVKISSAEDLDNFNKKLRQIILSLHQLCPVEWKEWKEKQGILETWEIISREAEFFLNLIEAFEFTPEGDRLVIYAAKEKKSYALIDPVHFVKTNLYSREDIFFYLLLGELMLEENFSKLQLYAIIEQVRDLGQN